MLHFIGDQIMLFLTVIF